MKTTEAEEYTQALGQVFGGGYRLIFHAERQGVPKALGMSTREWVETHLGGYVRLSIPERREAVKELVEGEGLSQRKAADVLGVDVATINRDLGVENTTTPEDSSVADATLSNGQLANQNGGSEAWSTPRDLFDELDREFRFETDVCALPSSAKCERYFTPEDDGLAQEWTGVCWMNPPYGDEISEWVKKAREAGKSGATVVCLVPARPGSAWFFDAAQEGEVRFIKGRLKFGGVKNSAPFDSALLVFGPDVEPGTVKWWAR